MRNTLTTVVAGALLAVFAAPSGAHHAFAANFDANKPIRFEAVITKMEWINPHVWIHVDAKMPDGSVEQWMIEAGSPSMLFRQGLNKNSITAGMEVIVEGYQARNGSRRANGRDITLPDGSNLFLSGAGDGPGGP
ncbi:MAG: hypothetical protein HKN84_07755 [Gammaproteobacteria bacterium]|nr:hypothetical protein [Gammaproteobacteria bacterium]